MIDFLLPFLIGVMFTAGSLSLSYLAFRDARGQGEGFGDTVQRDEFDMLCRVVHDMSKRNKEEKEG